MILGIITIKFLIINITFAFAELKYPFYIMDYFLVRGAVSINLEQ